ncbi:MAG: glycine zipper 2TM domain-containing protein [Desulfovibrionaceae bacterium]|nr:glycine zipper 2TM domain-containing protein [Desulfovibrionaceae bacterium]
MNKYLLIAVLAFGLLLSACVSQTGSSYSSGQTREAMTVEYGVITQLNNAVIEDETKGVGALTGGAIGGLAGSAIGGGSGRYLGAAGGALIGALAGTGVEKAMRTKSAQEITVRLDSGKTIVVVQQIDKAEILSVGDRVRVLSSYDGSARVRLDNSSSFGSY